MGNKIMYSDRNIDTVSRTVSEIIDGKKFKHRNACYTYCTIEPGHDTTATAYGVNLPMIWYFSDPLKLTYLTNVK